MKSDGNFPLVIQVSHICKTQESSKYMVSFPRRLQIILFLPWKRLRRSIYFLLQGQSINMHEGWFEALTKPTLFKLPRKVLMNFYYLPDHRCPILIYRIPFSYRPGAALLLPLPLQVGNRLVHLVQAQVQARPQYYTHLCSENSILMLFSGKDFYFKYTYNCP